MLSTRNILDAKILHIKLAEVAAQISAELKNGKKITAVITADSARRLELKEEQEALMIFKASGVAVAKNECKVRTSSANEVAGKITKITRGPVSTEIIADCDGIEICASITTASAERMQLTEGDAINLLIKATNVMVGICD